MPLAADSDMTTTRTTDFSTVQEDDTFVRVSDETLYSLLQQSSEPLDDETALQTAREYLEPHRTTKLQTEDEYQLHLSLLRQSLLYTGIPVLMEDPEDSSHVGVWSHQVEDLKRQKLVPVPRGEDFMSYQQPKSTRSPPVDEPNIVLKK